MKRAVVPALAVVAVVLLGAASWLQLQPAMVIGADGEAVASHIAALGTADQRQVQPGGKRSL